MKKYSKVFFLLIGISCLFCPRLFAIQTPEVENSEPYISLAVDKNNFQVGQEINFQVTYGNRGEESAKNIKISFNQPLNGRSPLEFISSDPKPSRWFTTEFGNLAEYLIEELKTHEATDEGEIKLTVRIRDSTPPQTLTPTANLQAPHRETGKRLIVSNAVIIQIGETEILVDIADEASPSSKISQTEKIKDYSKFNSSPSAVQDQPKNLQEKLLSSEALWTSAAFLTISVLLILAFFAGRKSGIK